MLHVDTASYYGGDWASFTLEGIQRWAQQDSKAQVQPSAVLCSRSREPGSLAAKIELPPGAGVEYELRAWLHSIFHRREEILYKKIMVAVEVFVHCDNFNPIILVQKRLFSRYLLKLS